MAEVKASLAALSAMPVTSVTMCEGGEDSHTDASVCEAAVDSTATLIVPTDSEDGLSVATEVDYSISSPDSGHGTSQDGHSEEALNAGPAPLQDSDHVDHSGNLNANEYQWNINGQHTVMEPVGINPETGFTTVLVDASAMAGYPHGPPTSWSPGSYPHPMAAAHLHPHPPPHFLHPHPYDMASEYAYVTGYDSVHPGHYEAVPPLFDHSMHIPGAPTHLYGAKGPAGRPNRHSRGSSISPKRPNNRSASQNNGSAHRRGGNSSNSGRYTPSPSSGGSRGSSPGQTQAAAAVNTTSATTPAAAAAAAPASLPPPAALLPHGPNTATLAPPNSGPMTAGQHVVHLHVNHGETVSLQMGGQVQVIQGPATVRMVSTGSPPVALPVQVPPGHVLQQIVDERGTLRHVILSPAPATAAPPATGPPPNPSINVLPLATPPHPPPPHYTTAHNVGQPPPQFFGTTAQGYGPQGGYPTQYGAPPLPPNMISHGHGHSHSHPQNFNVPTTTGPSSPPPAVNYHNERVQRQSVKLKKKLESRARNNSANSVSLTTPPSSPRKDNNNIRKLKDRNQNEATATENEAEKEGEVKDDHEVLAQLIKDVKLPQVQDVSTRSANISWSPVEPVIIESKESDTKREELDISYELLVGEKGKVKHKYVGKECHYRVVDLQPGREYWIRLSALVRQVKIKQADLVEFKTETCPPDVPLPPEISRRNRNSLQLKWDFPADNGSHITHFIVECDDGQGTENFVQVYEGRNRLYTINKLQPATTYAVRLAAWNKVGSSGWSEVVNVTTLGNPPGPPAPPTLREAFVTKLSLCWPKTSDDQIYTLQICEPDTGHGFRNVYSGPDNEYTCTGLLRSTVYRFRLQTENDDGVSRWSDEVSYPTASDRPTAPLRPSVKGRIHPYNFRIRWDPPADNGGSPISEYYVELDAGHGFVPVWNGSETEFVCDKLQPGTTYRVRVSASNTGGRSDFSDPCSVTTEAVCPGPCAPPVLHGKPKANSLQLKWDPPDFDGGALISQYEVNMTNPDGSTRVAYIGRDTECLVASLLPGRSYSFQVRSSNRIGPGPWSESLRVLSGPGVPDAPSQLQLTNRSPQSVLVSWNEPVNNGSPIVDYKLEMGLIPKVKRSSSADSLPTTGSANDELSEQVELERLQFLTIYSGIAKSFEMKGLQPATTYRFRVQASNSVGLGAYSSTASITTLASSPGVVSGLRCVEAQIHNLLISWNKAHSNGSAITNYNIEVGDKTTFSTLTTSTADTTFNIESLHPDTSYRIRVQAVNAIGAGPFSSTSKFSTRPLPPRPPQIECAVAGYNNLKLRWGDGKNIDFTQYSLEMAEANSDEFYLVYEGTSHSYKVPKLSESTIYKFRICARNDAGEGPYSDVKTFSTTRAPPPPLKKPDVLELTERSCRIVWSTYRLPLSNEQVAYQVEVVKTKDHEYIVMQRCLETELIINSLEPGTEYSVRIYPVRLCDDGEIQGAYSPMKEFTTLRSLDISQTATNKNAPLKITDRIRKPLTDQQIIMMIMFGFFFIVMLGSYVLQRNFFP